MTDAEKKAAQKSNAVNRQRFEQQQRISRALAIMNTATGVTNALSRANFVEAFAIAAAGATQIATINRASYGAGGGSVGAGSGTSSSNNNSNPNQTSIENTQSTPSPVIVNVISDNSLLSIDEGKFSDLAMQTLDTAIQSDVLIFRGGEMVVNR